MPQAIPYEMGPYYLPRAVSKLQQESALTGKAVPAQTLAQLAYGGEMAAYQEAAGRQKTAFEQDIQTQRLGLEKERTGFEEERVKQGWATEKRMEEQAKSQERADIVKGIVGVGGAIATAVPAISGIAAGIGAYTAAGTAVGMATSAASLGAWQTVGYVLAGLLGCCFTFDAGNLLTENVRKYRDEHYDKYTSPVSFGYRWMSKWIVPLMKNHKSIWSLTHLLMLKPLACYADWYYGDNSYGWIFYFLKVFWINSWRISGLVVQIIGEEKRREVF